MIFATVLLLALSSACAQQAPAPTEQSNWDKVKNFVQRVTGSASDLCSNQYVSGPYLEKVFCDKIIPDEYTQKLNNITFGADTDWYAKKREKKMIFFSFFSSSFFFRLCSRRCRQGAAAWRACTDWRAASTRRTASRPR